MEATINDLLKMSPPVALASFIMLIGFVLKKTESFPDRWIPVPLLVLGGALWPLIGDWKKIGYDCPHPVAMMIIQGVGIAGIAIGLHQVKKQIFDGKQEDTKKPLDKEPPQ